MAGLIALSAPVLASVALALAPAGQAATLGKAPGVSTGGVTHVRGTSALLQGTVNPHGLETTYFFQYGPTLAYGSQTPPANAGKGTVPLKVGQTVNLLLPGYHYRLVASSAAGSRSGRDRIFSTSSGARLKFTMESAKEQPATPYGGTFVLRGTLSGPGSPLHPIIVQSSPFPFLTPFANLGAPLTTNAAGAFAFPARGLTQSTQFRVTTRDARPVIGPIVTARVAVKVTLKARSAGHRGLVRLYGTVTPARVGAPVLFQVLKAVRPYGKSESEVRYATQDRTVVKRGTRTVSRFSSVVKIRRGGRYRAYVRLRSGALVSGSSPSITLHAAPVSGGQKR